MPGLAPASVNYWALIILKLINPFLGLSVSWMEGGREESLIRDIAGLENGPYWV